MKTFYCLCMSHVGVQSYRLLAKWLKMNVVYSLHTKALPKMICWITKPPRLPGNVDVTKSFSITFGHLHDYILSLFEICHSNTLVRLKKCHPIQWLRRPTSRIPIDCTVCEHSYNDFCSIPYSIPSYVYSIFTSVTFSWYNGITRKSTTSGHSAADVHLIVHGQSFPARQNISKLQVIGRNYSAIHW